MSALSLEYLRLCGLLLLPVVFLATLSAPGSEQVPRIHPSYLTVPSKKKLPDLLAAARKDPRIERVARAICELRGIDPNHEGPPFPEGPVWEIFIPDAMRFLAQLDAAQSKEKGIDRRP